MAAPVLQNQAPASDATYVVPNTKIYLEITDADADLVAASVILKINGKTAWSSDAAQSGFAVTKTAITNGFSYEIEPFDPFVRGTTVQVDVYAEDAIPNSLSESYYFVIGTDKYLLKRDHFDNSAVDLSTILGNGSISEPAGTELVVSCPAATNCYWWTGTYNAPIAYTGLTSKVHHVGRSVVVMEAKLNEKSSTQPTWGYGQCGIALFENTQNAYMLYYSGYGVAGAYFVSRILAGSAGHLAQSGTVANPGDVDPHVTKIYWNSDPLIARYVPDLDVWMDPNELRFYFSTNGGSSFSHFLTTTLHADIGPELNIGCFVSNSYQYPQTTGEFDYLDVWELVPAEEFELTDLPYGFEEQADPVESVEFDDQTQPHLEQEGPTQYQSGVPTGQTISNEVRWDDITQPADAGGQEEYRDGTVRGLYPPFSEHVPSPGTGPQPSVQFEDEIAYFISGLTDYRQDTTDSNGHPHFVSERIVFGFFYDAAQEAGPWTNPTDPSFTGYGKDGNYYVSGVDQGTNAPWADETETDNRGPRADFPDKALICVGFDDPYLIPKEIVIFDLDNFPTSLDVWMRFEFGPSGGSYTMLGRVNQKPAFIKMSNGILGVVCTQGDYRGHLILINFTRQGDDCAHLIRSDAHYRWSPAGEIADRNLVGSYWTTSGVSPSLRTDSEYIYALEMFADGATTWVAVGGEDPGPNFYKIENKPTARVQVTGETGSANIGDARKVAISRDGTWFFTVEDKIFRLLSADYLEDYCYAYTDKTSRRLGGAPDWVQLPHNITQLIAVGPFLYAGTEVGIYQIDRGSFDYWLAYTIEDGGGGGKSNSPPAGEILAGPTPEIVSLQGVALNSSRYLFVATYNGITTIRVEDDQAIDSRTFPSLHAPIPHFNVTMID